MLGLVEDSASRREVLPAKQTARHKKLGLQSLLEQLFLQATEVGVRIPPEA